MNPDSTTLPNDSVLEIKGALWLAAIFLSLPVLGASPDALPTNSIGSWSFYDTNGWTSDYGVSPVSFTNLATSYFGNPLALVVDSP